MNNNIWRIALVGGPAGGKTTALKKVAEHFTPLGYKVYQVPEVATLLFSNGVSFRDITSDQVIDCQSVITKLIFNLEDSFMEIAKVSDKPSIIICDRGVLDGAAFTPPHIWEQLMKNLGMTYENARARYNAVIHLVTAAYGAEQHYSNATNAVRSESPAHARAACDASYKAWIGHSKFYQVGNSGGFEYKMECVIRAVTEIIG